METKRVYLLITLLMTSSLFVGACGDPGKKSDQEEPIISYKTRSNDGSCELPLRHLKGLKAFCTFLIDEEINEHCAQEKRHNQFRAKCIVDGKPVIEDVPENILNPQAAQDSSPPSGQTSTETEREGETQAPLQNPNDFGAPSPAPSVDSLDPAPESPPVQMVSLTALATFSHPGEDIIHFESQRVNDMKNITISINMNVFPPQQRLDEEVLELFMENPEQIMLSTHRAVIPGECSLSLSGRLILNTSTSSEIILRGQDPILPNQSDTPGACEVFASSLKATLINGDTLILGLSNMPHPSDEQKMFSEIQLEIQPQQPDPGTERDRGAPEPGRMTETGTTGTPANGGGSSDDEDDPDAIPLVESES